MKLFVTQTKKDITAKNELLLKIKNPIPASDIPYYVDFSYDRELDKVKGEIIYGSRSEPVDVDSSPNKDIIVSYGKNSGRIYNFQINNFVKQIKNFAQIQVEMRSLKESVLKKESNNRIQENYHIGKSILKETCKRGQELLEQI